MRTTAAPLVRIPAERENREVDLDPPGPLADRIRGLVVFG